MYEGLFVLGCKRVRDRLVEFYIFFIVEMSLVVFSILEDCWVDFFSVCLLLSDNTYILFLIEILVILKEGFLSGLVFSFIDCWYWFGDWLCLVILRNLYN